MAVTMTPGLKPDIIDYAVDRGYKGLVLECYGAGGVNTDQQNFLPAIRRAIKKGVRVVCVSQCLLTGWICPCIPWGSWRPRPEWNPGAMTLEAAVTRLMWSLANETEEA